MRAPVSGCLRYNPEKGDVVETPEDVASVVAEVIKHVPKERIQLCTNCGMAPMRRDIAYAKLTALAKGAALARTRYV